MFKILVLGNPDQLINYFSLIFGEKRAEIMNTYWEWHEETQVLEDTCEVDIDIIIDPINADYDTLISMSDGIFYFVNPTSEEELELFQINISIIRTMKREIPSIIIFHDENGVLPFNSLDLLQAIWLNYPEMEAFVNLPPHEFYQALQCSCLAMINGENPLNIENAWLRFPFFLRDANKFYKEKNFPRAARALKKVVMIADIYQKDEYYVLSEKCAHLFALSNLFLEASKILEGINDKKASEYKRKYIETQIEKGDELFQKGEYEAAALKYTQAGQLAALELMETEIIYRAFKLAMKSWIYAREFEKAFALLERLPHTVGISFLNEMDGLILNIITSLLSSNELYLAKTQLEIAIKKYQQEGLFESLKEFVNLHKQLLLKLLEEEIESESLSASKTLLEELEQLWTTYKIEKVNLDLLLEKIVHLAVKKSRFELASTLINKVNSLELQKILADFTSKKEEESEKLKREEKKARLKERIAILQDFIAHENFLMEELNAKIIDKANQLLKQEEFLEAYHLIQNQIDFLLKIDKPKSFITQLAQYLMSIVTKGNLISLFFKFYLEFYDKLDAELKKELLVQNFNSLLESLKIQAPKIIYFKMNKIFQGFNNILRDQSLYEESKILSGFYVEYLKNQMLSLLNQKADDEEELLNKTLPLLRKANKVVETYLNPEMFNFNDIHEKIAEKYIELGDISAAQEHVDKIDDTIIKSELFKKIQKYEARLSKKMEKALKREILEASISSLRQELQDIQQNKEIEMKQRLGYKRAFFEQALHHLEQKQYSKAIKLYEESMKKLIGVQKYNLAGVSLAVLTLLYLHEKNQHLIKPTLEAHTKNQKIFSETFPVKLVRFLSTAIELKEEKIQQDILELFKYLPLFPQETELFYDFMGWEKEKIIMEERTTPTFDESKILEKIRPLASSLKMDESEEAKRRLMKKKYWEEALLALEENDLAKASTAYLQSCAELFNKNLNKHALLALTLGLLTLAMDKSKSSARTVLNEMVKRYQNVLASTPEYQLLTHFLDALNYENSQLTKLIINSWLQNWYLFVAEKNFLNQLLSTIESKRFENTPTRKKESKEQQIPPELNTKLEQMFEKLNLKFDTSKQEFERLFKQRKALKKRIYQDLLSLYTNQEFNLIPEEYKKLTKKHLEKNDYQSASLFLTLHGLSLFSTNTPTSIIKKNIERYLQDLGSTCPIIENSFYITLLFFLITNKINNITKFRIQIERFLNALPLLEEEKILLQNLP
ncbi:MAG: hypothetical protein ACTSYC_00520 [Promethearchaeota archaeon]